MINLTILSGATQNVSVQLPTLADINLTIASPWVNFTQTGVQLVNLTVSIDWNASAGPRTGVINFTNPAGVLLDNVTLSFNVTLPKVRVYFDSFHGGNDYLNALPYLPSQFDFYPASQGIHCEQLFCDL